MVTELQFNKSTNAAPVGAESVERHYSPAEIGVLWNLSPDCVGKTIENEPGVFVIEQSEESPNRTTVSLTARHGFNFGNQ